MARVRTVEFLPEVFQTTTNKQFLGATLDQLVQEPNYKKVQGYIGRRVGPGVNPLDEYVKEEDATRTNYQLEPGVVFLEPDSRKVKDAITYPGITQAIDMYGGFSDNASRLYTSDYYTWDPFVDFDKFVNFSQYYWLPGGPDAVDVFAGQLPLTDTFTVTRENGVYTFSGYSGDNPPITLVRGGNYQFNVAQNNKETVNFRVTNNSNNAYVIDYQTNPTLTLVRGNTYVFSMNLKNAYPMYIKTEASLGTTNLYSSGVTNNGSATGLITFTVPQDAPDTLFYCSATERNMRGTMNIIDAVPGTGPGFWIQVDPGVSGNLIAAPNISGRNVLGVVNNGEDLGTVTFNVPLATAQNFYYSLNNINGSLPNKGVDLITSLKFDQINNMFVDQFLLNNPNGIDGITNLNGKTVVFMEQQTDPEAGGWLITSQFDPLTESVSNNGRVGSFDSTTFDQTVEVAPDLRYNVWQITYETAAGGQQYLKLNSILTVNNLDKFNILSGTVYSSTGWFKNANGVFEEIPLLTAAKSLLYYQDGTDPAIFGEIRIVDQINSDKLIIDDIIGKKKYTSPNGVVFTNGLKVTFLGNVEPASYANNSYYVEGVGTAIKLLPVENYVTPETYTKSATIPYDSTGYDIGNFDASLNQPLNPDYLVINRASPDLSAWSRTNRWFHVDVINASAAYNNTVAVLDNNFRGKRPILEYRAGTKLYNFGTQGKQPVDIIDFSATDAMSTINGAIGYSTDGYNFITGTRVIFAADLDPQVRNKIYVVEFIVPDPTVSTTPVINLVPASDATTLFDQTVVCLSGNIQQGKSYWYDGITWKLAQQKTKVNQAPFFDVYDTAGVSYGDKIKYPSTNFRGSKLFSYATGSGTDDVVLGFPLKYLSLSNVGDIVFDNNLYTDTFTYTETNSSSTLPISQGYVRQYSDRTTFTKEIGWQDAIAKSMVRQQFRFVYDGSPLVLDVPVNTSTAFPALQLYANGKFIAPTLYTYAVSGNLTTITITGTNSLITIGGIIEVDALSDQVSSVAFYQVPINLENNPFNENSSSFTLGTVRNHYESICENLKTLSGPINGANNTRDLGNIIPYGMNILQQSAPMTMAGYFMRSAEYNIFNSLEYNSREYEKFKTQLIDTVTVNDYTNYTIPNMLTAAINYINAGKTETSPFYWSDMLPASSVFTQTTTTITPISTNVFDLSTTYDFTSSNYKGLLVYLNNVLLMINKDYVVSTDGPRLTITTTLNVGDVVIIREYNPTYGNFVPNTPTKLGLYPAWQPRIYLDTNYVSNQIMIQGHDGSLTAAFTTVDDFLLGEIDFRDQLLLEFETRIYNNLKVKSEIPLPMTEVIPGQFRTTDYSLAEVNQILSRDFLSWIGWNKLNYQQQDYISNNEFTWNYSVCGNKLTSPEVPLAIGAWRGLYQYFYDTTSPNTTPWEMLGFTVEPTWWVDVYGSAPYTSDNLVLWDDLSQGKVADPAGAYYLPQYARPQLTQVIPTGTQGELLSPFDTVVGNYDTSQYQKSWTFGDEGPVEYSWRKSSSYPFAVMRLLALTRPAEFFSLFADRDLYKFDTDYNQFLYNGRYRLNANGIQVYGNGTSKASYVNWIVDYNQQAGINSTDALTSALANFDVRLCYRMASFSDKEYIKVSAEKSSPNSQNTSLLIPDDSYSLLLYKNQPFEQIEYSSVIVQIVEGGYTVYGYGITNPYFNILVSKTYGTKTNIEAGGLKVTVPNTYTDQVVQVPYGYLFTNITVLVDFLLSYGALLTSQGLVFDNKENGYILDWNQMAQEFLYWAAQGWQNGSIINLNPCNTSITAIKDQAIVDSIVVQTPENNLLDQNRTTIPVRDLVVERLGNKFKAMSLSSQTINYLNLKYTSFENMIVFDNVSIFNDLMYDPVTGARQGRLQLEAIESSDWNGQLDAQGFILNNPETIKAWVPNKKYTKGEIVTYKNNYWSAQTIVQPKALFDYADWVKSDYTKIQRGLLQNLPNASNQLASSYSTEGANLESDQDLVAFGLIGFRPRQYMTALNLSDISQVNVYKQFLKDKGTIRSVRLISNAQTNKETAEYDLFENWAILKGTYGANANRSFIEIRLDESKLISDPSTVQVVNVGQESQADQTLLLSDLWKQSYKIPNTNIFPTTTTLIQDTALPNAGYVSLNDVDVTVFSLDGQLTLDTNVLETIGVETTIWAAKVNKYDWNVYRCTKIPGYVSSVTSNLNATAVVTFTDKHNLVKGDIIVIRFVDATVDGAYHILEVASANSIVISLDIKKPITSKGLGLVLTTMRVNQASDVINLGYANQLTAGSRAWVDNNGQGLWTVLEKQTPFVNTNNDNLPVDAVANAQFGTSVSQGYKNVIAAVGSPEYKVTELGSQVGGVYCYLRDNNNQYALSVLLTLGATNTLGYGNSIDIGNQEWIAAGASSSNGNQGYASVIYRQDASNSFEQRQLLVAPDKDFDQGEFGYSVSMSKDERWLYVGAPGNNKVYAFSRNPVETQIAEYTTDGISRLYSFNGKIVIDPAEPNQLSVVYNNKLLVYPYDYSVTATNIVLTEIKPAGQKITILRNQAHQLDAKTYYEISADAQTGTGSGAKFTINNTRGVYSASLTNGGTGYSIGDTLTYYGANIGTDNSYPNSPTTPANNLVITVTGVSSGTITSFTKTGSGITNNYVFPVYPYIYSVSDIWSISVTVDGILQRPFIDYEFNTDSALFANDIKFNTVPAAGASIAVTANTQFGYVDTLTVPGLAPTALFGASIAQSDNGRSILIGATNDNSTTVNNSGTVYAFDRGTIKYIVSNVDTKTYSLPLNYLDPVAVSINGVYLQNSDQFINGQFSVTGGNVVLASSVTLNVGDVIEIENNIFTQVQKINANSPFDQSQFGAALDICPTNCSLYVGNPLDGTTALQAGSVDRRVNQSRLYGVTTSLNANPTLTVGDNIRINNQLVAVPATNTVAGLSAAINSSGIPNITSSVSNGYLTISVINNEAATEFDKLQVLPGTVGTAFDDLGFETFSYTQTITSPNPTTSAKFGTSLSISSDAITLIVGAPGGNLYEATTFDNGTTFFDDRSTVYSTTLVQSGAVYSYDYLPSANSSLLNPGKFAFGQQIYDTGVAELDQWGTAVSYVNGRLLVGSPGADLGDSTLNYGRVAIFSNTTNRPAWYPIHVQTPVADVALFNSVFMYNKLDSSQTHFFDFINPLQGKILGAARQNIDYISSDDPAKYNAGPINNDGNLWGPERVGQIWWDTTSVRFIDPNQNNIVYTSRRWAQTFPGSRIEVYQWIESDTPPAQYAGPGTPSNLESFTVLNKLNYKGIFETKYYFWVTGLETIDTAAGKTLSTGGIARYIDNPRSSGIPYIAPIDANSFAIYNGIEFLSASDTIIHLAYDREYTDNNIHTEYELISDGKGDSFLNANLYRKLQDSFCGVNSTGALVPDVNLSPAERYGVQFRPRQSMFVDRYNALKNYLTYANTILKQYPIVEIRSFNLLNSSEPEPTVASGEWNKRLDNIEQLSYQNIYSVPLGYKYLIVSDSTNNGLWTIYTVVQSAGLLGSNRYTELTRVQNYDTKKYWNYIDWYLPGYNSSTVPVAEVKLYSDLVTVSQTTPIGASVKVTDNPQGKFEIYIRTATGWDRVGLQDGTIAFSNVLWDYAAGHYGFDVEVFDAQYFDQEPVTETRKIIQAINEELFIDDLAVERNRALILIFNYILSEFQAPDWLMKTSLINVNHNIRSLLPYQIYRQDNQDFVLDYIQEVKPYHVQISAFNLAYNGDDAYAGQISDFDSPSYYDRLLEIPQYVNPVLLPYTKSTASGTGKPNSIADTPANAEIWTLWPWSDWYNNYLLSIVDVTMIDGGTGYTEPPQVVVTGDCVTPATMTAIVNSAGNVVGVNVVDPGAGYLTTAVITFTGGNGVGARAYAVMGNNLVRSFKTTIKYDRYQYTSTISNWQTDTTYAIGTQVRYLDTVWEANQSVPASTEFNPDYWTVVSGGDLSGIDRTQGYYVPTVNTPGLELPLLIDGLEYPGVQVYGLSYNQNTGYDVGNFDINPFDNISYGPEGRPTYDPALLDAIYASQYLDPYLGTRATDINVDGGAYIDTYSSYAPEELVPGSEFDTLDMRVYTRPGADWDLNGHGFPSYALSFVVDQLPLTFDFSVWYNYVPYLVSGELVNETTRVGLLNGVDYTVDWTARTFTITSGCNIGDYLTGIAYGVGGGNQLYRQIYVNTDIVDDQVTVPVQYSQIQEVDVWVNGQPYTNLTYAAGTGNTTIITFGTTFTSSDSIVVYVLGPTTIDSTTVNYSWSSPTTQYIVADGSSLIYNLDNSLEYTNPINLIVNVNGVRARTAAGIEYYADGSTAYLLPDRLGFSQSLISDNEVLVYINDIPQTYNVDFTLEPYTGGVRHVVFTTAPTAGERILIGVTTNTQAKIVGGNQLAFSVDQGLIPSIGDIITVTTFNDTRQQDILTTVYVGPVTTGITVTQAFDTTDFDSPVSGDLYETQFGQFDYSTGATVTTNNLYLNRVIENPDRLVVTKNGFRLFFGEDFTILNGNEVILASGVINAADVIMITEFTNSIATEAMAFRIFQDMRGVQATYRITPNSTTMLTQTLNTYDDIIYVENASHLDQPDVAGNIWGVLTIDGERIMYRERDVVNNTVSSLLRGTAGTAIADHEASSTVYALGRGELLPKDYQDYIDSNYFLADGTTTVFTATNISFADADSTLENDAVEVWVGSEPGIPGNRITSGYTLIGADPVKVEFDTAPAKGVGVTILVRRGVTWYAPGVNTPSNGQALQVTDTKAARFLRGQ